MHLHIVIPSYNRINWLKKTIHSLRPAFDLSGITIVVIDNNSDDGTWEWLLEARKVMPIIALRNTYNLGIEGNIIEAMRFVEDGYIWLLSDHMVVDCDELKNFINYISSGVQFSLGYARIAEYDSVIESRYSPCQISKLSLDQKNKLIFCVANISAFIVSANFFRKHTRSVFRFSGFSFPHLGVLVGLKDDDLIIETHPISSFDSSLNYPRSVSYNSFYEGFIGFAKARDAIRHGNIIFKDIHKAKQRVTGLNSALGMELLKTIYFRNESSPNFLDYAYCFFKFPGRVRAITIFSFLLSILPLVVSKSISHFFINRLLPTKYKKYLTK